MFNALLGGFVAWSLTAGALPGPWPVAASLALGGALLLLHGHTHVSVCREHENYTYVNPGSVSLPKNGSRRSYLTAEGTVFSWKDLTTGETWQTLDLEHPEDC